MELFGFVPNFGNIALTLVAFVAALSVIVAVHEYGHYIVGRWSGIHAEVFSLGFGPVIFSRVDKRGTRWQLSALPFGGFVKFLGDADAASGKDGEAIARLSDAERRHTMHGAPLWARSATVAAGPVFNFILSILIFAGFFLANGVALEQPVIHAVKPTPFAGQGLLPGDEITAVDGIATQDIKTLADVSRDLPPAATATYSVNRDGNALTVEGPFPFPPLVDAVHPQSAALAAGLREGDFIQTVDGKPILSFDELRTIVGDSEGRPLQLSVWRGGETVEITLVPRRQDLPLPEGGFETRWMLGLSGGLVFQPETRTPGVVEAGGLAVAQMWDVATTSLSGLWHMVVGKISLCNLQGPVGIAETSGQAAAQGPQSFILFIAMLSTAVGLLNLFPVPVLDGGHLVFHAWEAVTGRPPGDNALRVLMSFGLVLVLSLMTFALLNDLVLC